MTFTATFNGTDEAVVLRYRSIRPKLIESITRAIYEQSIRLQAHIVGDKLQGQVLHHRTGKLSASIRVIPPAATATGIEGKVQGAGGPAWYGRLHEYGGTFQASRTSKAAAFSHRTSVLERGRTYTITFPERSFMRSGLEDLRAQIGQALRDAVYQGVLP